MPEWEQEALVNCRAISFDADRVRRWAQIARDSNPLHLDTNFAASTSFGTTIVHGHLTACVVGNVVQALAGDDFLDGGRISFRFRAPVPVGEDLQVEWQERPEHGPEVRVFTGNVEALDVQITLPKTPGRGADHPR